MGGQLSGKAVGRFTDYRVEGAGVSSFLVVIIIKSRSCSCNGCSAAEESEVVAFGTGAPL